MSKSQLKIAHVSHNDSFGGADRAGFRIHKALIKESIDSIMFVNQSGSKDPSVHIPGGKISRLMKELRPRMGRFVDKFYDDKESEKSSPGIFSSSWPRFLNQSDVDIVHLHWPHNEMMSVADISRIKKPMVWTLHDMWAFCGAEHYTTSKRYMEGYTKTNRPDHESGLDINRLNWKRKKRLWKKPITVVGSSQWMADCASSSDLMKEWPVYSVKSAIDLDYWKPVNKSNARSLLGLPSDKPIILFGAIGGVEKTRKGFDLLKETLIMLYKSNFNLNLAVVGQQEPSESLEIGYEPFFMGHHYDDLSMKILYNASDAVIIPSRQDNLPNMGIEALACGVPVVAFDTCGLPDIVEHKKNGFLAKPFDTKELAEGIKWVVGNKDRSKTLSKDSRESAMNNFSEQITAKSYIKIYNELLNKYKFNDIINI